MGNFIITFKKKLFLLFEIFFVFLFSACVNEKKGAFLSEESVTFVLPVWNSDSLLPELSKWKVELYSNKGVSVFFTNEKEITWDLDRNRLAFILATPITVKEDGNECAFFKACGAIYPHSWDAESKKVNLSWVQGFTSYVMKILLEEYVSRGNSYENAIFGLESFNWERFNEILCEKVDESLRQDVFSCESEIVGNCFYNPWLLDIFEIVSAIAYGDFSAGKLNMKDVFFLEFSQREIYSSFVPECMVRKEKNYFSVKKNSVNFFSLFNSYGIIVEGEDKDSISMELISLPEYNYQ